MQAGKKPERKSRIRGEMRIVIDATSLLLRSTGVKNYMYYWIRALQEQPLGECIRLFPYFRRLSQLNHERSCAGKWATRSGRLLVNFCNIRGNRTLDLLEARADVFHASQNLRNPPRWRPRLTATIYDMTCWILPETHTPANVAATKRYGDQVLRRAAACTAISESARRDAIEILGLAEDRVETIYPGVADGFFAATPEDARAVARTYGLERPYILFVGMIEPRKNIDRVLDVYSSLSQAVRSEYELVVAGALGWCKPETVNRLLRPAAGIRYLGYVPESDLPGLTAGAALFFYPALYEGFGLPVAQAMACGVPVITSRGSALEEIGGKDVVTVEPHCIDEMAAAVERLALSPGLRSELGQRGRRRAAQYTWARCAEQSLAFFRRAGGA
jgi:alpha-1,3-rhamnosyl/mannosyltransferase